MMYKPIAKFLTKNFTRIPLLWIDFNYKKYKKFGEKGSCLLDVHPILRKDKYIIDTMDELASYIKNNYDMNKII